MGNPGKPFRGSDKSIGQSGNMSDVTPLVWVFLDRERHWVTQVHLICSADGRWWFHHIRPDYNVLMRSAVRRK